MTQQTFKRPPVKPLPSHSDFRVPPQDLDAEQALLGAIILSKRSLLEIRQTVDEMDFYREAHRKLYKALINLDDRNEPFDMITISDELKRIGEFDTVGGASALSALVDRVPTAANAQNYADIVRGKAYSRWFINKCTEAADEAYSDAEINPSVYAENLMGELVKGERVKKGFRDPAEFARITANEMFEGSKAKYIPTGFGALDSKLGGIRIGHLGVITGPAEQGKSTFFSNVAVNVARMKKGPKENYKVTHLILEDDDQNVMHRQVCLLNEINIQSFESNDEQVMRKARKLDAYHNWAKLNIWLGDKLSVGCMWDQVKLQILRQIKRNGIDLLLIEGAELLETKIRQGENKADAESRLANELDTIAQENEVAVWLIIGKGKSDEGFKAVGTNAWWKIQRQSIHVKQDKNDTSLSIVEIGKTNDRRKWKDPFYFETLGDTFKWKETTKPGEVPAKAFDP